LLDKYRANTLFGNIDQLLPVNEAFLNDLEKMIGPNGQKLVGGLGDVCLKHVCHRCFKCPNANRESNGSSEIRVNLNATSCITRKEKRPSASSKRRWLKEANPDLPPILR